MRRREFCLGLAAMPALARSAFADEVSTITLISQHGLPYLPLMVMENLKLVEKHAGRLGLPNLKTDYRTLGGTWIADINKPSLRQAEKAAETEEKT